ncbi:DUF2213 domain-containing protein [Leptolyngbyaceae cyanobacterium CCMR0082]|uniref:DUF2213 domain-containing protein n=1 Tax=Adonisia turfae CCMR0082 TaxID=2304604 RepID=A0A6M0S1A3_9CYAN|nr:DUF2213 domain-containing protein [Adonisia turfae]NEZ62010.1 DUF2213 domain-containing protein [Adonisia turfae CCMR0082]
MARLTAVTIIWNSVAVRLIEAIANIEQFERQDSGSLKVTAIARTPGILTYFDSNGPRKELVTSAFLRSSDQSGFPVAGQLAELPVTLEHPPSLLRNDAAKIEKYSVGETAPKVKVYQDGRIQVEMEVKREDAISAIESGKKRGVSLGYLCDINRKPGSYLGERYDAEQCAPFEADHLAIVARPRAKEALIKSFERTDSEEDFAVAYYEDFAAVSANANVVDSPRSDSMGTETAATVAISDAIQAPETFQIEINGKPHRVDAATYADIQAERADAKKKVPPEFLKHMKGKKGGDEMDDDDDDDDDREDMSDYKRKDAADKIATVLARCDADTLNDAIHNLNVLVGRFDDSIKTVADAVDAIDQMRGRTDALNHTDSGSDSAKYDADDVAALLKRLDAETPADALTQLEGKEFVGQYGHMLPSGFNFDGQSLHELQLEAIKHVEPGLELHSDSEQAVAGAFSVVANRHKRVDSSQQLDQALHMDMIHSQPGADANRRTNTRMTKKPSESLFALSKAVRRSGSK